MRTELLWKAIWRSDPAGVQHAIRNGASLDCFDLHQSLQYTCLLGDERIVRILLDAGADARWRYSIGNSAIMQACRGGHLSIVEMLLNHDKDLLEFSDSDRRTPLFFASDRGHVDVVQCLLEHGANIHATTQAGTTALMAACISGHLEVMRMLLAAGSDVEACDRLRQTALNHAAMYGRIEVVRELILQHNANMFAVDEDGNTPFDRALWERTGRVADLILEMYGNKMTADHGRFALRKNLKVAEYNFDETKEFHPPLNPLRIRLPLGNLTLQHWRTVLQALDMELIRKQDDSGKLPIHIACQTNVPLEVLSVLVELDPTTLQIADHKGNLPLHECCLGAGDSLSVQYLVEQGGIGTLAVRNRQGLLPLHVLCGSKNPPLRTVQYLIQSFPPSVSMRTNTGEYPFMMAACNTSSASLTVVYELVRASPDSVVPSSRPVLLTKKESKPPDV